ncbi:OpgC family protein [Niveispirillum sp.]|uniref:OpgC family protein n=1 Tax=Niveispirillum sp. TaxID=1917217 RepID=UPI001B504938|nr:OpgC domain-containing protein [Niveispirillum sp.]MBP7338636.1 OpgC domain-containing protein [Niveispirillum sp.]
MTRIAPRPSTDMSSQIRPARDPRIDLFRGAALLAIFINHIPGNPARFLTWAWLGFSDAAELFMLLAGLSMALGYWGYQARHGWPRMAMRLAGRSFRLYRSYLLLALALSASGAAAFAVTGDRSILWHLGIEPLLENTVAALPALFALQYLPGYADILATYVPLMLVSTLLLPLAARGLWLVLVPSGLVWGWVQLTGANLSAGFDGERWMFNPLAWQFLFCIGLCIGVGVKRGLAWPQSPLLDGAAIAWVLIGLLVLEPWRQLGFGTPLPAALTMPQGAKDALGWQRLLHILALAHLVVRFLPATAPVLHSGWLTPLRLAGRHPLPVFALGAVLSFAGHLALTAWPDPTWARVALINTGGLTALLLLAALLEWLAAGMPRPDMPLRGPWHLFTPRVQTRD